MASSATLNAEAPSARPESHHFSLESLKHRADFPGLRYFSMHHSVQQLPHFGLTWKALADAWSDTRKPVGDLGASYSTLALEGGWRGVPVQPVDITFKILGGYDNGCVWGISPILNLYRRPGLFPAGFELTSALPVEKLEDSAIRKSCGRILANAITADIAEIPVADRAFSVTLVHEAVPKYAASAAQFLNEQLPEILRVTDREARIYPLERYARGPKSPDGSDLHPAERIADYTAQLSSVARRAGFRFELASAFDFAEDDFVLIPRNDRLLGIFIRA